MGSIPAFAARTTKLYGLDNFYKLSKMGLLVLEAHSGASAPGFDVHDHIRRHADDGVGNGHLVVVKDYITLYRTAGSIICASTLDELRRMLPAEVKDKLIERSCLGMSMLLHLLDTVYQMPDPASEGGVELNFVQRLNGVDGSWSLGGMFAQMPGGARVATAGKLHG